jgi:ligand-binding sensor domain-containing protein/signal transduction histidine kinase/DNA-binding NarL/FixJ family response regulator
MFTGTTTPLKIALAFSALIVCTYPACAQTLEKFTFDHLGVEEGLSQSTVFAITQDADGFMWFGTRDGLNRYDSRSIKTYRHEAGNTHSLSSNSVHCLLVDSRQQLWVGTNDGINLYHTDTDNFTRSKLNPDSEEGLHSNHIAAIHETRNGAIWIGTHGGLAKVVSQTPLRFALFRHDEADNNSLLDNEIRALNTDRQGNLWVGTTKGVSKLIETPDGKYTFINYPLHSTHIQGKSWVNGVLEDDHGNILIATEQNGIKILDPKTGKSAPFNFYSHDGRSIETVRVLQRHGHTLWIGTLEGMYLYDLAAQSFHFYKNDPDDNLSLSDNSVRSVFRDQAGTYWIGTFYGGVNYYSPLSRQFDKINVTDQQNRKIYKIAGAMITDHQNNLWIGTDGNGLFCQDVQGKTILQLKHQPDDPNTISHNKIKCLLQDDDKGLWIGTINGLNYYNFKQKTIRRYFHDASDPASLSDDRVYDLAKDSQGNIWIGTYRGGLCKLNKETKTFERFTYRSNDPTSLSSDGITYIYEDSGNNLWVGTVSGLNKKPKGKDAFIRFVNPNNQNNMYALCIYEDKQKRLWTGTRDGGLKLKDKNSHTFRTFTTEDGLAGNSISGILEDTKGFLWISTENGLSRLDPTTLTFKNYNKNDGLICSEFNFNSFHKDRNEFMYFGGYNGIVKFHPDSIQQNIKSPALIFTRLKLFNEEVMIDSSAHGILHRNLSRTTSLEFKYAQNIFSVEFAALSFIHPGKNKYAYKLESFEEHWNYVSEPVATYMNLRPGQYTLLAKGSNNDGVWNPEPIRLAITVLPPLWKTWWAYSIYVMIILSLVYALLRFNKMRWKLTHDLKIEQLEKEQQEKLHKAKLNFFTNIAHEIRTPLTLIVSPLELTLERYPNDSFVQKQLHIVKSNTNRLVRLINQLLDFQKQESGTLKLRPAYANIVSLVEQTVFSFSEYARSRDIQLELHAQPETIYLNFDRDELEKVFCNLLYNAFKFTPGGGKVSINITQENDIAPEKSFVKIILEDNGIGIGQADLPKIFNRFFQVEHAGTRESGFGIGLALTKGIIDLHGGTIAVESHEAALGQSGFTRFIITLPKNEPAAPEHNTIVHDIVTGQYIPFDSEPSSAHPEAVTKQKHPYHVLLVDDNIEIRHCIRTILSPYYTIHEASNGMEACTLAKRTIPDLIISDIAMPEMDGLEFTRHIKDDERTQHIPVILLTARDTTEHHVEGIDEGADDYITKPFHSRLLLLKIRNLLAVRETLKEKYKKIVTIEPRHEEVEDPDNKFLQRLMRILDDNINDADFNVSRLVTEIGMSRPVLFRKVKVLTGMSVIDLIRSTRLKKAEMLLRQKKMSISEVAFTVGFNDPKYFSKSFHAQFGTTPSKYMESLQD